MNSKKLTNYKLLKLTLLFSILIFSFWRSPYIFQNGRFIGEEATYHFIYALENTFLKNLFYYADVAGYINLLPNILLEIATKVPIKFAPLITVYGSFFFIILLPYFCLFRDSQFLDNENKKILASLVLFLSPPFVPEIWINSLNSQIYLCFISILIFFMINLSRTQKNLNHILLLLGGLSGIYTCALLPLFGLKFYENKTRYNFVNMIILLVTNLLQSILIIHSKLNEKLHTSVLKNDFTFEIVPNFFYNIITKPFFGRELTHLIWNKIFIIIDNSFLIFFISFFIIFFSFFIFQFKKIIFFFKKNKIFLNLVLIFIIISAIILVGSLNNQVGGRYAVISGTLLILCALEISYKTLNSYLKSISFILIFLSIAAGIYEFRPNKKNIHEDQYIKFLDCIECPDWKSEIEIWKNDNNYIIKIWPYPQKTLDLSKIKIN